MNKKLKIYSIEQNVNDGWDTYSDAVVIAENDKEAKRIHPANDSVFYDEKKKQFWNFYHNSKKTYLYEDNYAGWTNDLTKIKVEYLGDAKEGSKKGIVCASFYAG